MTGAGLMAWAAHAFVVTLLLAGAAWCLDRALGRARLPTRWVWLAALWLSVGVPAGAFVFAGDASVPPAAVADHPTGLAASGLGEAEREANNPSFPVAFVSVASGWASAAAEWGAGIAAPATGIAMLFLWGAASTTVAGLLVVSAAVLARRRRRWPRVRLRGRTVRLSPEMGPAVAGVLRPEIILPRWCLALDPRDLELVLSHEETHLAARDPLLMAAALVPVCLLPWHPATWWQLRRFRDAAELDCDRRVLRRTRSPAAYGRLLLRLGHPSQGRLAPALSLSGSGSLLERRLNAMKKRSLKTVLPWAALGTTGGVLLAAVACDVELPLESSLTDEAGTADLATVPDGEPADGLGSFAVAPLYIVGDLVVDDLRSLNADDIESVQVLRGEVALERYGEAARDGAVRIRLRAESDGQSAGDSSAVLEIVESRMTVGSRQVELRGGRIRLTADQIVRFLPMPD